MASRLGLTGGRIVVAILLACSATVAQQATAKKPKTYQVTVNADGSFTPSVLKIRDGDTVEWMLNNRTNAIIPAAAEPRPGVCPTPRAYDPADPNDFTGPLPLAPSGIYTLGPLELGMRVEKGGCSQGQPLAIAGKQYLCLTGVPYATMDTTWRDPNLTGVFIRLLWNQVQLAPGTADANFDFTVLDREISKAVQNGKLYSLAFKAGNQGTPDWLFSTNADGSSRPNGGGGVARLRLQDADSKDDPDCGVRLDLGNPTEAIYQKHFFDLLTKVANHIRARADWYRALAYIKPSGANFFSHENRLPRRCNAGCVCNTQVFAEHGYTPTALYAFYKSQFDLLATLFPGKAMSYQLIQDGFPLVNDTGGWVQADGSSSNGLGLPRGAEQTETILDFGQSDHGAFFTVQHNGLNLKPPPSTCPNENKHPATPPYAVVAQGCPNRWVLEAGADAQQITGFQNSNADKVSSPEDLNSSFENAFVNSDASFVEIYEARFWEVQNTNGSILPDGKTIGAWAEDFHTRRRDSFPNIADPFPKVHRHTFHRTVTQGKQFFYYYDPAVCGSANPTHGTILIKP